MFRYIFLAFFFYINASVSQEVISYQNFDLSIVPPGTRIMSFSQSNDWIAGDHPNGLGTYISGSSSATSMPANTPYSVSSSRSWGLTSLAGKGPYSVHSRLTFSNEAGLEDYHDKYFEFRLAAFSVGVANDGVDSEDSVTVDISLDGGLTWSTELKVYGMNNSRWSYTSGTGVFQRTYDGVYSGADMTSTTLAGGNQTTRGWSTIRVHLPDASTQARIRINLLLEALVNGQERWIIDNVNLIGTLNNTLLPVNLSFFNIEKKNKGANLVWSTSSEQNNNYFDIEMTDEKGENFIWQGRVRGNGNSSSLNNYNFFIGNLKGGTYYFRLKQVDYNGEYTYSEIKSVTIEEDKLAILKIKENLTSSEILFSKEIYSGSTINIFKVTGEKIYSQIINESSKLVEVNQSLKGLLIFIIEEPNKKNQTFRVSL